MCCQESGGAFRIRNKRLRRRTRHSIPHENMSVRRWTEADGALPLTLRSLFKAGIQRVSTHEASSSDQAKSSIP
eukprot:2960817-Karenia_brevis.AAC.1